MPFCPRLEGPIWDGETSLQVFLSQLQDLLIYRAALFVLTSQLLTLFEMLLNEE